MGIVEREVRPGRSKKDAHKYPRMVHEWWKYWQNRQGLERAVADLDHVLALSLVSNAVLPVRVPTGPVFAHKCAVFAMDGFADLAVLSSSIHATWVIRYTSTLETRINYSPNDVFRTLPRPETTPELAELGKRLDTDRRELMLGRGWGLTTAYQHHVHNPADRDPAVVSLREIHTAIDHAVLAAYGWDLDPEIGHHPHQDRHPLDVEPTGQVRTAQPAAGGEPPPPRAGAPLTESAERPSAVSPSTSADHGCGGRCCAGRTCRPGCGRRAQRHGRRPSSGLRPVPPPWSARCWMPVRCPRPC